MEEALQAQFARVQWTHWWFCGRRAVVGDVLERRLGAEPRPLRILEVGCGTGAMTRLLTEHGDVTGVDPSERATAFCRVLFPEATFVTAAVAGGVTWDREFDLVAAFDVIEHIEDDVAALASLRDALVDGGLLVVTVPAYQWMWSSHDDLNHHFRRYTRQGLRRILEDAGYLVERVSYFNSILFPGIALARLARRGTKGPGEGRSDLASAGRVGDALLTKVFAAERFALRRRDLPFGVSLLALARRP